jgi:hypothetical protein
MRKEYIKPQMEVVEIKSSVQVLAGSTPEYGGGSNVTPQAPELLDLEDLEE